MIAIYGNSNLTVDIATLIAIECARAKERTLLVELGEGTNPKLSYAYGIEEQRIKTSDNYLINISKNLHLNACLLRKNEICDMLTEREKTLISLIKKLPENLSILPRKAPSEDPALTEDEYKEAVDKLRKDGFENHDIIIVALSGNCYSYPVFFSTLYADENILVTEETAYDIRSLNRYVVDMKKVQDGTKFSTIFLDYNTDVTKEHLDKTALNVEYIIPMKDLLNIRLTSSRAYTDEFAIIKQIVNEKVFEIKTETKKKLFQFGKSKGRREDQNIVNE